MRRKNAGEKIDMSYIWDNPVKLTKEQGQKGYKWLMNLWKSPTGKERVNNPFGYREQLALEGYQYMTLDGDYDAGNFFHKFYVPLYTLHGKSSDFQYYVSGGKVHIVG